VAGSGVSRPGAADAGDSTVRLRDVARFDRERGTPLGQRWWVTSVVVVVYIATMVAVIVLLIPVAGLDDEVERRVFGGFSIVTAAYTGLLAWLIWRNVAHRVRIDRLAVANGLVYSPREPLGGFAGTATDRPGNQMATDVVSSPSGAADEGGDFTAATFRRGSGLLPRRAAFVQMRLDRATPHIVLLNRRSRVLGASGSRFVSGQRLRLEGDFDRTFTLLCPAGYERDALYIFTPDVMAVMLDVAPDCEIELVDGWLVAYVGRPWRLWRSRDFAAMLSLVHALGPKARSQTRRYRDDRAPIGIIGGVGRRLRMRPSAGALISLVAPVALGVVGVVSLFSP
jgi:hypothetical protein